MKNYVHNIADQKRRIPGLRQQKGSVMVVAALTLSGLLAVAALALMKVKRGMSASGQSRFQSMALFAAESGISAGMDFLRNGNSNGDFTSLLGQSPSGIAGNTVQSGQTGSVFTSDVDMSYTVTILNNRDDPTFAANIDSDGIAVLSVVGRGPGTSMVVIEVEVTDPTSNVGGRPCTGYAQGNLTEDGAGRNDCLGVIDSTQTTVYAPGT